MISSDIYEELNNGKIKLFGFYSKQVEEEIFKAKLIQKGIVGKETIFKLEDDDILQGNITALFIALLSKNEEDFANHNLAKIELNQINRDDLLSLYKDYKITIQNDCKDIWGELLLTNHYSEDKWRVTSNHIYNTKEKQRADYYEKQGSIMMLSKEFNRSSFEELDVFLINRQKDKVSSILGKVNKSEEGYNWEAITKKEELYLLYIASYRILGLYVTDFFKGGWQFGWLPKEDGFRAIFDNQVFQCYKSQFRYKSGLREFYTPKILLVSQRQIKDTSELYAQLMDWTK